MENKVEKEKVKKQQLSEVEKDAIEFAKAIARMNPEMKEKFKTFFSGFAACADMLKNDDKQTA